MNRNRIIYSVLVVVTIAAGLASRQYPAVLPPWVHLYLGDTLWGLMAFLIFGIIFPLRSTLRVTIAALAFSYSIEISQLYHAPWIDALRGNALGGAVLGFGFLWSDLVCYTIGIALGFVMEKIFFRN